ncbi:hypothetical protein HK100_007567 [Physocladia obscura]|uniref:Cyclin-domain-containing protein n=1 Tax=Physocladia obscura TaxID=109957 RepID=A0AAD5XEV2_9FUNG|nr:hypothetical protein HK100_007567 [Physocladia obscura]
MPLNASATSTTSLTTETKPTTETSLDGLVAAQTVARDPITSNIDVKSTPQALQTPAQSVISPSPHLHQNHALAISALNPHAIPVPALTVMIADMLQRLTSHNDQIPLSSLTLTRFHSRAPPGISILDYLRRIVKYASVERVCLLILLVYIDRSFTISSLTVHRFIITGVTVACKALCDSFLQNSMYAKVGGISTKELNVLEIEFLTLIGWDLTASAERLQDYYRNLVRQHPGFRMVPHADITVATTPLSPNSNTLETATSSGNSRQSNGASGGGSSSSIGGVVEGVRYPKEDWTGTSRFVEAAEAAERLQQLQQLQEQQQQQQQIILHNINDLGIGATIA